MKDAIRSASHVLTEPSAKKVDRYLRTSTFPEAIGDTASTLLILAQH